MIIQPSKADYQSQQSTGGSLRKSRRFRTVFNDFQLKSLEESFEKNKYLSEEERAELSSRINLTEIQIASWYQNRRTKWKRQSSLGVECIRKNKTRTKKVTDILPNNTEVINPGISTYSCTTGESIPSNHLNPYFQYSNIPVSTYPQFNTNETKIDPNNSSYMLNNWYFSASTNFSMSDPSESFFNESLVQYSNDSNSY